MSAKIVIVDYGMGNLNSVKRVLSRLKIDVSISAHPEDIAAADKIILPGVGHFSQAMANLHTLKLLAPLNNAVLVDRKPILGICLGMQLMAKKSEEGNVSGLGWIDGDVVRFNIHDKLKYKIPHIGWNQISMAKPSKLMTDINPDAEFYFVHSYHFLNRNPEDILNTTEYEYSFTSAIEKENIFGVQYHPEKSHDAGEQLFKNFCNL
jgi:glutamine amidotransferase